MSKEQTSSAERFGSSSSIIALMREAIERQSAAILGNSEELSGVQRHE
jgi:hypothetical protein